MKRINKVKEINELSYIQNVEKLVKFIKLKYRVTITSPALKELLTDYNDYDGNVLKDIEKFEGLNTSTAGDFSFPEQISEASMVYNDVNQGKNRLETIIGAVFSYAFQCGAKAQELEYKKGNLGKTNKLDLYLGAMFGDSSDMDYLNDRLRNIKKL